jgi:hypothetical protein
MTRRWPARLEGRSSNFIDPKAEWATLRHCRRTRKRPAERSTNISGGWVGHCSYLAITLTESVRVWGVGPRNSNVAADLWANMRSKRNYVILNINIRNFGAHRRIQRWPNASPLLFTHNGLQGKVTCYPPFFNINKDEKYKLWELHPQHSRHVIGDFYYSN